MNLQSPITSLKGIGEKTAERFNAAGINTVEDVLGYYPRSYENFEQPAIGLEELADGRMRPSVVLLHSLLRCGTRAGSRSRPEPCVWEMTRSGWCGSICPIFGTISGPARGMCSAEE